jgi:hypothetical protein
MHTALNDWVLDAKQFCDPGFHFLRFEVEVRGLRFAAADFAPAGGCGF